MSLRTFVREVKNMTFLFALQTVFEIVLVVGLVWCFFHEDKLIAFEKNIVALLRRKKLKLVKNVDSCNM